MIGPAQFEAALTRSRMEGNFSRTKERNFLGMPVPPKILIQIPRILF